MRILLFSVFCFFTIISCSDNIENEGFYGQWEGESTIIIDGNPVVSETSAIIAEIEDMTVECNVIANGLSYIFDTKEEAGELVFSNAPAKNLAGGSVETLLTGSAKLIGDTVLIFQHQVVTLDGGAIVSSVDYDLEFKRPE